MLGSLVITGLAMAFPLLIRPALTRTWGEWFIGGDFWASIPGAYYIANGAYPFLYEANFATRMGAFPYPPGLAIFLAPIALFDYKRQLGASLLFALTRPTAWLLFAPYATFLTAAYGLSAIRSFWIHFQIPTRRILVAGGGWMLSIGWFLIGYWWHFEDMFVAASILLALVAMTRSKHRQAAYLLGLALLFKQTAIAFVPLFWVLWPRPTRRAHLVRTALVVGVPVAICLAGYPRGTLQGLTGAGATVTLGQVAPLMRALQYLGVDAAVLLGAPFRLAWVAAACGVAWAVRRWGAQDATAWLAGAALIAQLRLFFEPTFFGYYTAVPTLLAMLWACTQPERAYRKVVLLSLGTGIWGTAWFTTHVSWWPWTLGAYLQWLLLAWILWRGVRLTGPSAQESLVDTPTRHDELDGPRPVLLMHPAATTLA